MHNSQTRCVRKQAAVRRRAGIEVYVRKILHNRKCQLIGKNHLEVFTIHSYEHRGWLERQCDFKLSLTWLGGPTVALFQNLVRSPWRDHRHNFNIKAVIKGKNPNLDILRQQFKATSHLFFIALLMQKNQYKIQDGWQDKKYRLYIKQFFIWY